MPNPPHSDSRDLEDCWAEVRGRNLIVRYRRSGVGRPLLLLDPGADTEPFWPELLEELKSRFRLVIPSAPGPEAAAGTWLAVLVEGLGISNVTAVVSGQALLDALCRLLPEQISRVILVSMDETPDAAAPIGKVVPVLVVQRAQPAFEVVPRVVDFLAGEGTAARA